jgi:queuine tRNA-ribosyltransferase
MYKNFGFDIILRDSASDARLGLIKTPHGNIQTPNFVFCATKAAMKGVSPQQMHECGTQIILSNTYHLMLQPGGDVVEKMGGLQKYTGWRGPMLTDSGGFQIFSLGHGSVANEIKGKRGGQRPKTIMQITEEGAKFKSYLNGDIHLLTPEKSIRVQRQLGADLIVVLDECTPFHVDKAYTERSMHLSHRWAMRSLAEFIRGDDGRQALYGIVQGGIYNDLREISAGFVSENKFFGQAIGGSLGSSTDQMQEVVGTTMSYLSKERPVHLLGIGGIKDIFYGVRQGIDTFDCVHPTRLARHGGALVKACNKEHISLRNSRFREDPNPIDATCTCMTCKTFSRSYLHHLFKARELLGPQALSIHNITFMNDLMSDIRSALQDGTLDQCEKKWV